MTLRRFVSLAAGLAVVVGVLGGCAYYNTYYLAKRYYTRSLDDLPYPVDKADLSEAPQLPRAIDMSRKLIEHYPKSKWKDDAYILWAKALMANDDPRQAVKMLEEFDVRYPGSPVSDEARFYRGVACLRARKYERAAAELDTFLVRGKPKDLVPFARLEHARAMLALERPGDAVTDASVVLDKYGKSKIARRARETRAQALLAQKQYRKAREDYRTLERQAVTDEDRLVYLLHESECLEVGQQYEEALDLLRDALAHEREPPPPDTTGGRQPMGPTGPGTDRYGRLLTRVGTVELRAGKLDEALAAYRRVVLVYPRTPIAAEAQYRIGYAYEIGGDDFDKAREEYGHVRDHGPGTSFADQAANRVVSLERLAKFRSASSDSMTRKAEIGLLLAEQYLFELDKPDRALEEYQKLEKQLEGSPLAAKAVNAQAWVLSRKLDRKADADSLFWRVVRNYPATEAQLAARDYLAYAGVEVPSDLIKLPEPVVIPDSMLAADTTVLTHPPDGTIPLGSMAHMSPDDSLRFGLHPSYALPPILVPPPPLAERGLAPPPNPDSGVRAVPGGSTPPPSAANPPAGTPSGPPAPPPVAAQPDTSRRGSGFTMPSPPPPRAVTADSTQRTIKPTDNGGTPR